MKAEPYNIHIAEDLLIDVEQRLRAARFPNDLANDDWRYGTQTAYLKTLIDHWVNKYDWRAQEKAINRYKHYRVVIEENPIHFIHEKGIGPAPVPLILSHGWPWTFWDFRKIIGPLTDPVSHGGSPEDAFDVIVPSLPGFSFSTPLTTTHVSFARTADLWARLMTDVLGYSRYGAHGADFGLVVTEQLGHKYSNQIIGIHVQGASPLDFFAGGSALESDYEPEDAERVLKNQAFATSELGYMAMQTTKPQTLANALNDSLVGLCSWILEKRRSWSDCGGEVERCFSKDDLITTVMLYWLTESIGSSFRFYYESAHNLWQPSHDRTPVVESPSGVILFKNDIIGMPRRWAERYMNLKRWTVVADGGHFGAMERPEILVEDLRAFFRTLREV